MGEERVGSWGESESFGRNEKRNAVSNGITSKSI